jgi:hypothetical protein
VTTWDSTFHFSRPLRSKIGRWPAMCSQHPNFGYRQPCRAWQAACRGSCYVPSTENFDAKNSFFRCALRSGATGLGVSRVSWCVGGAAARGAQHPRLDIYIYVLPEPSDENSPFRAGFPPCTCPSCTGASWHPTSSGLSVARHYEDITQWGRGTAHMPGRCVRERQAACGAAICRPRKLLIRKIVFFSGAPFAYPGS